MKPPRALTPASALLRLSASVTAACASRTEIGALQAGVDIPLGSNMSFNIDVKKIYMKADVNTAAGAKVTTLDINPVLIGVGLGWKF